MGEARGGSIDWKKMRWGSGVAETVGALLQILAFSLSPPSVKWVVQGTVSGVQSVILFAGWIWLAEFTIF